MILPRTLCLAALVGSLLLSSCVRWNIGRNIREHTETWVGVDLASSHEMPPGQVDSSWPRGGSKPSYYVASEVSYTPDYPLVGLVPGSSSIPRARHIEYTGALRTVTIPLSFIGPRRVNIGERMPVQAAYPGPQPPELPAGLLQKPRPTALARDPYPVRPLQPRQVTRSAWYIPAAIAAAPFDYLIDPALSLVSTPILWAGAGIGAGVSKLFSDTPPPTTTP